MPFALRVKVRCRAENTYPSTLIISSISTNCPRPIAGFVSSIACIRYFCEHPTGGVT